MEDHAVAVVRGEWLYEIARRSQQILCDVRSSGMSPSDVVGSINVLPAPSTPVECLVRHGIILQVLLGCLDDRASSSDERVENFMRRVLESSARPLPLRDSPENRAAAVILARRQQPVDVAGVARIVGCHQSRLRRSFRETFGMSMRDFHTRCRIAHALTIFAGGESKTSAVARTVGYRSDKNFYRALRDVTGKKPKELKSTSPQTLEGLARHILSRFDAIGTTGGPPASRTHTV
jgi:AraC-like DNA-binding protein